MMMRPMLLRVIPYLFVPFIAFGVMFSATRGDNTADLDAFLASGHAVLNGQSPYTYETIDPSLNPPILLPVLAAVASLDPLTARWGWYGASVLCYLVSLLLLARIYPDRVSMPRVFWALSLAPFWWTLAVGQIYLFLLPLAVGAYLGLERRRHWMVALCIGALCAVKPNFLVWPGLILLAGQRKLAASAIAVTALLSALPILAFNPSIYAQWWAALPFGADSRTPKAINGSLFGFAARLGLPDVGLPLSILLLATVALIVFRTRPPIRVTSTIALASAILAAPLAWPGYVLFLLPFWIQRDWSPASRIVAALLVVPTPIVVSLIFVLPSAAFTLTFGSLYTWVLALTLIAALTPPTPQTSAAALSHSTRPSAVR